MSLGDRKSIVHTYTIVHTLSFKLVACVPFQEIVQHFRKSAYSLSCLKINLKINTTLD